MSLAYRTATLFQGEGVPIGTIKFFQQVSVLHRWREVPLGADLRRGAQSYVHDT